MSKRSHASSALSGSSLLLGGPVVLTEFTAGRHAGSGASSLLLVPVLLARVATERVRLIAALSLSLSSLGLFT